eukprot:CAMPEP_0204313114 /NCGR_PEP_ID=MMETSP0469-20131031/3391_1 /ASSEMBLY_ACC=CAM_ASM_000384 /TAXON_ID=2969 /ORGANISM="Oxyrrhis marina" /LENGTH=210 /DNA_ID=CAMNT_0051293351 /DNA_START=11 /DNA_END=643 /DNA_ORIENTATION=+
MSSKTHDLAERVAALEQELLEKDQELRLAHAAIEAEEEAESLHRFGPRCGWLVGLLIFQSSSSLILEYFSGLIEQHQQIVFFLTMLVGAGGNAGGQSVVLVVRSLALGREVDFLGQLQTACGLVLVLTVVTFGRAWAQGVDMVTTLAIGCSMAGIVFISVIVGTLLPLSLFKLGIDPAHSSAAIQVLMDISGISLTCAISLLILGDGSAE